MAMLGQTAPILAELSAVERVLARERAAHAETRDALQHANRRAREARAALAAEASTGVLQLVRKAVVDATNGSSSAQQRLDQLYLILPPRDGSQPQHQPAPRTLRPSGTPRRTRGWRRRWRQRGNSGRYDWTRPRRARNSSRFSWRRRAQSSGWPSTASPSGAKGSVTPPHPL